MSAAAGRERGARLPASQAAAGVTLSEARRSHWVLLRGLAREAEHWGAFPDIFANALRAAGRIATIETLDLPGTGALRHRAAPPSIDATAEAVREAWMAQADGPRAADARGPRYLLAMSLGGMVANAWTARWPEDFSACVLINTSLRGYSPIHRRLRPSAYGTLLKILMERDTAARERAIVALISNRSAIMEATARDWVAIAERRPIARVTIMRQFQAAARFRPKSPAVPALVLASLRDRLVHPSCSQEIATRWRSDLRLHPDAGHDLALDDPEWIAAEVCAWLAAREQAPG